MPPTEGSFDIELQFTNQSGAPISVWNDCGGVARRLTACVDGYQRALNTYAACAPICPDVSPVTCGACYNDPLAIAPGEVVTAGYSGFLYEPSQDSACIQPRSIPAGSYRVTVPVFGSNYVEMPGGGIYRTALYEVSVDFDLPDSDGVVAVPLDAIPYVHPCPGGVGGCLSEPLPSRVSECELDAPTTAGCPEEAPVRYVCSKPVPLDPRCVDPEGGLGWPESGRVVRCCPDDAATDAGIE